MGVTVKTVKLIRKKKTSTHSLVSEHEYFHKEVTHNDRGNGLKNYTLIFNLLADGIKEVTYVKIDIIEVCTTFL